MSAKVLFYKDRFVALLLAMTCFSTFYELLIAYLVHKKFKLQFKVLMFLRLFHFAEIAEQSLFFLLQFSKNLRYYRNRLTRPKRNKTTTNQRSFHCKVDENF